IGRRSVPVEITGDDTTSTDTQRSILELESTFLSVPFGKGGNQPATGLAGAPLSFFQVQGNRFSSLGSVGQRIESVARPNWMNGPLLGMMVPRTDGYLVFEGAPTFRSRTITHTHEERTAGYRFNVEVISGGDSDNAIATTPFSTVDAGGGNDTVTSSDIWLD